MSELALRPTDVPGNFTEQMTMARAYADSGLLPNHLRDKPANVLVILGAARALNLPAFFAFQSLYVVGGKLGMEANLMRSLCIRAGHQFETREMSAKKAVVAIKRSDKETWFEVDFTMEDAKTARLAGDNWTKYPRSMLHARATVMAIRAECPEVLYGVMYTPEELGAKVGEDGQPVVDNNGVVVLDSTAEEVAAPDQATVERIATELRTGTMENAANAYVLAMRLKIEMQQNADGALFDQWCGRLKGELARAAEQQDRDALRRLWKYAHGTGLLGLLVNDEGDSVEEAIRARIDSMDKAKEAVDTENAKALQEAARESFGDG